MSSTEIALQKMISVLLSIELGAACSYSEPPIFGFTNRDSGKKIAIAITFASLDNGLIFLEEPAVELPKWVEMVGIFLRKREDGDNFFLINRKDFAAGHVRPMEFAQVIEKKMRFNVSRKQT